MQSKEKREGSERKKKKIKPFGTKSDLTTIHASPKKKKNDETHQMMWWNFGFNHYLQPHMPLESG